ncbi:hypothetical protein GCM10009722_31200 [Williamsia deligens]
MTPFCHQRAVRTPTIAATSRPTATTIHVQNAAGADPGSSPRASSTPNTVTAAMAPASAPIGSQMTPHRLDRRITAASTSSAVITEIAIGNQPCSRRTSNSDPPVWGT